MERNDLKPRWRRWKSCSRVRVSLTQSVSIMYWSRLLSLLLCVVYAPLAAADVGFRAITHDGAEFGIWYPTQEKAVAGRLGAFDVNYAMDAAPAAGAFPLVILSHGVYGRYRNHHLTAALLAENGFIVIAPQHFAERKIRAAKSLPLRVEEINDALTTFFALPEFAAVADRENLNAIGYSLGSATILAAAGGKFSSKARRAYCRENAAADQDFCGHDGSVPKKAKLIFLALLSSVLGDDADEYADRPLPPPLSFRKIALVAPVGQGWEADSLTAIPADMLLLGLSDDRVLPMAFHAERLREIFPSAQARYQELNAHHYAFIAPFPQWLTDQEDIPVAHDPDGFDRGAFLQEANQVILEFLQ